MLRRHFLNELLQARDSPHRHEQLGKESTDRAQPEPRNGGPELLRQVKLWRVPRQHCQVGVEPLALRCKPYGSTADRTAIR